MDCPYCGSYIEKAIELQRSVSDEIKCPFCGKFSVIKYDECFDEEGNDCGNYYLDKEV